MITVDFIQKIDNARVELLECTSREEVEKVFIEFVITDYPAKTALLRRCMQIKKTPDIAANDEATYEYYIAIFLSGEWKKTNQTRESAIPDSGSSLSSADAKKQSKESNGAFDTEKFCKDIGVSKATYKIFKDFFDKDIVPRMQKKYLAQLISVVEDLIEEKICERGKKQKPIPENRKTDRYRINLSEFTPDSGLGLRIEKVCSICFSNFSVIFYNPKLDDASICFSIAHELGQLLLHYRVIGCNGADADNYADLFASLAVNEENNL